LGILLEYPHDATEGLSRRVLLRAAEEADSPSLAPVSAVVGFLGAGNYAGRVLIPAFREAGAQLHTLVSGGGVSALHYGRKNGFREASTDSAAMLAEPSINTVVIATRHNVHARQVLDALRAGKNVFCEKPLCLTLKELVEIETEIGQRPAQQLMVGFNRRFSPHVARIKTLLETVHEPISLVMTVNAGKIPPDHWTQDCEIGGGRILGEACHFVDLLRHLAGAAIKNYSCTRLSNQTNDTVSIQLKFENGSIGTIHYFANGHQSISKERLEIFAAGRVLQLDNFRRLRGYGWKDFSHMNRWRQDKGVLSLVERFVAAVVAGNQELIPINGILEVSRISIELGNLK